MKSIIDNHEAAQNFAGELKQAIADIMHARSEYFSQNYHLESWDAHKDEADLEKRTKACSEMYDRCAELSESKVKSYTEHFENHGEDESLSWANKGSLRDVTRQMTDPEDMKTLALITDRAILVVVEKLKMAISKIGTKDYALAGGLVAQAGLRISNTAQYAIRDMDDSLLKPLFAIQPRLRGPNPDGKTPEERGENIADMLIDLAPSRNQELG